MVARKTYSKLIKVRALAKITPSAAGINLAECVLMHKEARSLLLFNSSTEVKASLQVVQLDGSGTTGNGDIHSNILELEASQVPRFSAFEPSFVHYTPMSERTGESDLRQHQLQTMVFQEEPNAHSPNGSAVQATQIYLRFKFKGSSEVTRTFVAKRLSADRFMLENLSLEEILMNKTQWAQEISLLYSTNGQDYFQMEKRLHIVPNIKIHSATIASPTACLPWEQQQLSSLYDSANSTLGGYLMTMEVANAQKGAQYFCEIEAGLLTRAVIQS